MGTTIAVSDDTHQWLSRYKQAADLRSMDEVLNQLARSGEHVVERLFARRRTQVKAACRKHRIQGLVAFGSRVWGAPHPNSDLDLVARFAGKVSLFDVMAAEESLAAAFGVPVDLHLWSSLKPRVAERVRSGGVRLLG